jgi:hypothetical protein
VVAGNFPNISYSQAITNLKVIFDNVEGPKLSFEEKNLTDSIFNAIIKYYKMTPDQYKDILSKVKLNRPEMLLQSEDAEIEDKVENDDQQKDEHGYSDLFYNMEDLFNENFVSFIHDSNVTDVSRCRRTKRVNSDFQTDRRVTRQRKNILS